MPSPPTRCRRCGLEHLDGLGEVLLGHDDVDRTARAGREVLGQHLLPVARLGCSEHQVARGHAVGLELQQPDGRRRAARRCTTIQTGRACRATKRAWRGQRPVTGCGQVVGERCAALLRDERPEGRAPEQREQGGQERERRQHGERDADRRDRPERAVGREVGQQQAEESGDHRAARGDDGFERAPPRPGGGIPRGPRLSAIASRKRATYSSA